MNPLPPLHYRKKTGDMGILHSSLYTFQSALSIFHGVFLEKCNNLWMADERCRILHLKPTQTKGEIHG